MTPGAKDARHARHTRHPERERGYHLNVASGKQSGRPSRTTRGQRQAASRDLERTYALAEVAQAVARVGTPEEWGTRVVAAVARATGWSRVFVFRLVDLRAAGAADAPSQLELLAAHGITPEQETASRQLALDGPSASAQAVNTRAPVVVGRTHIADGGQDNLRRLGTIAYAVFPLIAREKVFGTLTLLDTQARVVSDEEVAFLHAVADTLATGLESAELFGEAQAASRAKDDFLAVASHELRTPLTPLKGLTQTLQRQLARARESGTQADLDRFERYLHTMNGQVDRLTHLVNDLLDVSRIRIGRLALRLADVDLVALTATVLERFDTVSDDHVIRFERSVDQLTGHWDAGRLEQVLTNLIANSLKYTPAGGTITVTLRYDETGETAERSRMAHVVVRDPGIGIPARQIVELFRPFHRLENAPAEHFAGLGLGLYISHDIVDRHGGRIWAESEGLGQGATFHVVLPLTGPESAE